MQSAALSFSDGFRHAAKHAKPELSDTQRPVRSIHSVPSLPHQQHGVEDVDQAIGTKPRKSAGSYEDRSETRTSLHRALKLHVSDPAKIAARKTGASVDTVDNHLAGNVPQSWASLIAYCRAYPAFGLEILDMIGIDIDRDREAYSLFLALQKQVRGE